MSTPQIISHEQRLLTALQNGDIATMEELIHDDLLFHIPNGQVITKDMDLAAYRDGNMMVHAISVKDQVIQVVDDTAIVSVMVTLKGSYMGQPIDGDFRYLRVWKKMGDTWQVIAGSSVQIS